MVIMKNVREILHWVLEEEVIFVYTLQLKNPAIGNGIIIQTDISVYQSYKNPYQK